MMKKTLVAAFLGSLLLWTTSCGTLNRAGKDVLITVTSPYIVLHGAGTDGAADATNIQTGLEASDAWWVLAFPFTFTWRAIDHTISCAIHAGDFVLTPFYALAEIHPDTNIEPLQIYYGTPLGPWPDGERGADAETGEAGQ